MSAATFEVLWHAQGLGDMPTALFVPVHGSNVAERKQVLRATLDELRGRGLAEGPDLRPDVTAAFQLLQKPVDEFYGWMVRPDNTVLSVFVAVRDQQAVQAVLDNDRVWMSAVQASAPAQAALGVAPRNAPARGRSITAPMNEFAPGGGQGNHSGGMMQAAPHRGSPAGALRQLVGEPSTGHGQFFVATRDERGHRRKSTRPVYYLDTQAGRWLIHVTAQQGGQPWINASPGTPEALARALYDTRRELLG
jgi:ESX secretion-associated protein EspG